MALQEKEFVVKNGLNVKNSVVKLNDSGGSVNQLLGNNTSGTGLEWKTLNSGDGILVSFGTGSITINSTGTIPAGAKTDTTFVVGQNLLVGGKTSGGTRSVTTTNALEVVPGYGTSLTNLLLLSNDNDGSNPKFIVATSGNTTINGTLSVSSTINGLTLSNNTLSSSNSLSISSATTNSISIDSGTTGAINIGIGANAKTITVGNSGVATSLIVNGTGGLRISNIAAETTSTYASMTGAVRVAGGIGVTGNSFFGGTLNVAGGIITGTNNTANTQKVDQLTTFTTSSLSLNAQWTDSGIVGNSLLANGLYQIKIQLGVTQNYWLGFLPWYGGNGSSSLVDFETEIPLSYYGDGSVSYMLYAKVSRFNSSAPKLQIAASTTTSASTYSFTTRKLMD